MSSVEPRLAFKTEDLAVLSSALFKAQPSSALFGSALRLWLYVGCLLLEGACQFLLQILTKVGACCCYSPESRGYDRIGESGSGVPSPFGGRYPFVYTDKLRTSRDSEGRKYLNSYLVLETLDTGSSGKVKLAVDLTTREYYVRRSGGQFLQQTSSLPMDS
jgi:hypothetical protein